MITDNGHEVVEIPLTKVRGKKPHKDGSALFDLVGGPLAGGYIRVYAPYMRVVFAQGVVYRLMPPARDGGFWVYAHDATDDRPMTEEERGDWDAVARDARVERWYRYQAEARERQNRKLDEGKFLNETFREEEDADETEGDN